MGEEDMPPFVRESYRIGRLTHSVVTPGELADWTGRERRQLVRLTYRLGPGGLVPPPVSLVAVCEPEDADGVARTMSKLLESRGWTARVGREAVDGGEAT
ncbi:MAG: hypothetical protein MSA61_08115 [Coriobacteriaceae bacterium]|nr:hypothetical protein [Coriobacteriaceae bacterium]